MGWLLELLFEGVREMCSQFIVDMMDVASGMFTEILSCDLNLFEELFGVAGDLYRNGIMPIAIMLLLIILVWQLFKGIFSKITASSEEPLELVFRSAISLFMIAYAKDIVNYILDIMGTPYQWVVGTAVTVDSFSGYVSAAEVVLAVLGIDQLSIQILLLIMQFVVAWNYFKMLFILAERYVLLGIFSYTAPLAFAVGGSKSTNNITSSWVRMFGGQVLIVILDTWCLKMFLSGYGSLMASGYGFTKFFAATMCLIGFCKITAKLDSYMASLGVNLGRIGGGLSGMGALLMAGRLLHTGGGSKAGGGSTEKGASHMAFGTGKPIPMGNGAADFGADGMSGIQKGSNIGGMNGGMAAEGKPEPEEGFGWPGSEDDFNGFGSEVPGNDLPFGVPDESDFDAQEDAFGGIDNLSSDYEEGAAPFGDEDMPADGSYMDAGEIPGMSYGEDGPFGAAFEDDEAMGAGIGAEDGAVSDFGGASQDIGMDMPGENGGITGIQQGDETEAASGAELAGSGIMSYGGDESAQAGDHIGGFSSGTETMSAPSGTSAVGEVQSDSLRTGGGVSEGGVPGAASSGENVHGADGTAAGGMQNASVMESRAYGQPGQAGSAENAGSYLAERDGERYMRYDASQFEKPQGAYQTIHEDGKTYYELPEKEKAPAILPETRAVMEKNGSIRLEKVYREIPKEKGVPEQRTKKKPEAKKNTGKKYPSGKKEK